MTAHALNVLVTFKERLKRAPETSWLGTLRQIREDFWVHDGEWMRPGLHAVAVHRFGVWRRGAHPLLRALFAPLYGALYVCVRNVYGIELPDTTVVGRRLRFPHQSGIVIHAHARIGDDCIIRQNVTIGAPNRQRFGDAPTLGSRVEVGAGAAIIGRVTIGDDVRIGPNAVVMTSVPAGSMVATQPPRIIRMASAKPVA